MPTGEERSLPIPRHSSVLTAYFQIHVFTVNRVNIIRCLPKAKYNQGCYWSQTEIVPSNSPTTPYQYESENPPSIAIIEALAELEDRDPVNLELTLYDYIHPEALNTLTQSGDVEIWFTVPQYEIHVRESGAVVISETDS